MFVRLNNVAEIGSFWRCVFSSIACIDLYLRLLSIDNLEVTTVCHRKLCTLMFPDNIEWQCKTVTNGVVCRRLYNHSFNIIACYHMLCCTTDSAGFAVGDIRHA